jgi:hypothetical protein
MKSMCINARIRREKKIKMAAQKALSLAALL